MALVPPPPPTKSEPGSFTWMSWYQSLYYYLTTAGSITWASIDKTGSNLADLATRLHSNLQGVLGTGQYHISATEATNVSNLSGTNTGDQIITLTGDVTGSGTGSFATTLATVNTNVGQFAVHTVNAKGLTTSATTLTGDVSSSGAATTLATVNSNVGSFGSSTAIPNYTVNGKGLITASSTSAVIAPAGTLSGATLASGVTASSLTSVGTLTSLTLSGTISQSAGSYNNTASNAGIELGSISGANTPFVDFHSSGNNIDYDVRLLSSGGTGSIGNGTLTITAAAITTPASIVATSTGGIGYGIGSGGTVTQLTSRTTGVTLNKTNGAITMFSAAGSATAATFTVTNSTIAATDVIICNQKSGTNLYNFIVTAVAAGSFNITFYTTGGTSVDAPVINFAVIKAVTS